MANEVLGTYMGQPFRTQEEYQQLVRQSGQATNSAAWAPSSGAALEQLGMSGQQYLNDARNSDVLAAYLRNPQGMTMDQFAEAHAANYGLNAATDGRFTATPRTGGNVYRTQAEALVNAPGAYRPSLGQLVNANGWGDTGSGADSIARNERAWGDIDTYLARNPDVAAALPDDLAARRQGAVQHYYDYGRGEGRIFSDEGTLINALGKANGALYGSKSSQADLDSVRNQLATGAAPRNELSPEQMGLRDRMSLRDEAQNATALFGIGGSGDGGGDDGALSFGSGSRVRGYQASPYLDAMAGNITRQVNDNLTENLLPAIRDRSIASGGYGGSRQGVAEGIALGKTQNALSDSLTSLYAGDYTADRSRALQERGMDDSFYLGNRSADLGFLNSDRQYDLGRRSADLASLNSDRQYDLGLKSNALGTRTADMNYDLGVRSSDLGFANLDRQIWNDNNSWQLQGANFGLNALDKAAGWAKDAYQVGSQVQNAPLDYWKEFSNQANGIARGFNTNTKTYSADPVTGAIGGWNLGNLWGKK